MVNSKIDLSKNEVLELYHRISENEQELRDILTIDDGDTKIADLDLQLVEKLEWKPDEKSKYKFNVNENILKIDVEGISPMKIVEDFERNNPLDDWSQNTSEWSVIEEDTLHGNKSIDTNNSSTSGGYIGLSESSIDRLPSRGDVFSYVFKADDNFTNMQVWFGFGYDSDSDNPQADSGGYAVYIGDDRSGQLSIYKDGSASVQTSVNNPSEYENKAVEVEVNWLDEKIEVITYKFDIDKEQRGDELDHVSLYDTDYDSGAINIAPGGSNNRLIFDRIWII